jgi:hypothetical protein
MNQRTEANINQLANDIHLATWPFRFIWEFIKTCLFAIAFIIAVPLLLVGLLIHRMVTGQPFLDADAVLALKVIFCFCQPFILPIVYRIMQWMGTKMGNRATVKARFCVSMYWLGPAVLVLELVGALMNYQWWADMATEGDLATLVVYLSSPLIFLVFTKDQSSASVPPDRSAFQSASPRRNNPHWN